VKASQRQKAASVPTFMSGRRVRHREHNSSLPATRPYVFLADEHYCTKLNDRLVYVDEQVSGFPYHDGATDTVAEISFPTAKRKCVSTCAATHWRAGPMARRPELSISRQQAAGNQGASKLAHSKGGIDNRTRTIV